MATLSLDCFSVNMAARRVQLTDEQRAELTKAFDNGLKSTASCNHREIKELGQQEFSTVKVRPSVCHDQLYTCQVYNYSYVN